MIINEGECILCNSSTEAKELGKLLHERGYRMFSPYHSLLDVGENWHGLRWFSGHQFPNCIVATSQDQKEHILTGSIVQNCRYKYMWYEDFMNNTQFYYVNVGDLI